MNKYIFLTLSATALMFASCSEDTMDEINKDNAHPSPEAVPVKFQLTDAILSTGFSTVSGDYAFYASSLTEQEIGVGNNQLKNAELRNSGELAASSTFNNSWNSVYGNLLNIKQIIGKVETEVPGNIGQYDILGMAQVLEALNFGVLTDMHGDIPYSEALQGISNTKPKLDSQKDVYAGIIKTLDDAIANLEKGKELKNAGAQDFVYGGDASKWLAAAYALKARYYIHQTKVDANAAKEAEAAAEKAIELGFDNFVIDKFDGDASVNPWSAYIWSRDYTAASTTVANLMKSTDDPRLPYYTPYYLKDKKPVEGTFVTPGDKDAAQVSDGSLGYPLWYWNGNQPIHLMSTYELYFILAEAQLRQGKDATEAFQKAVVESVTDVAKINGETAENAQEFAESLGTPTLKLLFEQKYISQSMDEQVETYNDIRRCKAMGESYITLTNPNNTQSGVNRFPNMLPYGNSAVISNPNVAAAYGDGYYIYDKNTWINGGD